MLTNSRVAWRAWIDKSTAGVLLSRRRTARKTDEAVLRRDRATTAWRSRRERGGERKIPRRAVAAGRRGRLSPSRKFTLRARHRRIAAAAEPAGLSSWAVPVGAAACGASRGVSRKTVLASLAPGYVHARRARLPWTNTRGAAGGTGVGERHERGLGPRRRRRHANG